MVGQSDKDPFGNLGEEGGMLMGPNYFKHKNQ